MKEMCYNGILVMPDSYVVIDEEEMTYVEGGAFYGVNLSADMCKQLADGLNVNAIIIGTLGTVLSLLTLIPGASVLVGPAALYYGVVGTVLTLTSTWFSYAAQKGGCHFGYDSSTKKLSVGWGTV